MLKGDKLRERAEELGVTLYHLEDPNTGTTDEPELQRRVLEAERALRESRLWIMAVISAAASVVSAAIALAAVLLK